MAGKGGRPRAPAEPGLRLDLWLFAARFFRSRGLAAALVEGGGCRLNGVHVLRPGHALRPGDTLTFAQGGRIRVIRVVALDRRRGPADAARALYLDLEAPPALE